MAPFVLVILYQQFYILQSLSVQFVVTTCYLKLIDLSNDLTFNFLILGTFDKRDPLQNGSVKLTLTEVCRSMQMNSRFDILPTLI